MRYLFFLLFLFLGFQSKSQEPTDPSMLIKINDILPYYNFETIRTYIWVNGDRKTYCPNYSDNPHLGLTDMNTEIYYNLSQKGDNFAESDYNIMFITSKLKGTPFNYYVYLGNSGNTYLYDYNKVLEKESDKEQALDKLKKIIDVMMTRANPKEPE